MPSSWAARRGIQSRCRLASPPAPARCARAERSPQARFRPLQGRLNVVLSRDPVALRSPPSSAADPPAELMRRLSGRTALPEGVVAAGSMGEALDAIPEGTGAPTRTAPPKPRADGAGSGRVWVIGGSSLYAVRCGGDEGCAAGPNPPRLQEALASPLCDEIHLTRVYADIQCDVCVVSGALRARRPLSPSAAATSPRLTRRSSSLPKPARHAPLLQQRPTTAVRSRPPRSVRQRRGSTTDLSGGLGGRRCVGKLFTVNRGRSPSA